MQVELKNLGTNYLYKHIIIFYYYMNHSVGTHIIVDVSFIITTCASSD
jgi:hypothetical protein